MDEHSRTLTCFLMYHRDDRGMAVWLKGILAGESINCQLLYDVAGSDIHSDMFRCADEADCVISLITQTLFEDKKCLRFHRKVYSHLDGQKYMAVRMSMSDRAYNSPDIGFLEGCHVLSPEKMTDEAFRECLVREMNAVVRPIRITSEPNNRLSSETDIESTSTILNISESPVDLLSNLVQSETVQDYLNPIRGLLSLSSSVTRLTDENSPKNSVDLALQAIASKQNKVLGASSLLNRILRQPRKVNKNSNFLMYSQASQSLDEEETSDMALSKTGNEACAAVQSPEKWKPLQQSHTDAAHDNNYFRNYCKTMWEGKAITVARKKFFEKPPNQFLKSPFLLPILSIEKLSPGSMVTYPYISRNLGQLLSRVNESIQKLEVEPSRWRRYLLPIIYQVGEALEFLHSRNIVHGSVSPTNILIDEHGNARLGAYGLRHESGSIAHENAFLSGLVGEGVDRDISMFGITILQILKCMNDRNSVDDKLCAPLDAVTIAIDERYVEDKLWELGDEVTRRLCEISLQCLSKSHKTPISQITGDMKELITDQELKLITFPCDSRPNCVYCMVGMPKQDLRARSSSCPEECTFLNICPSCIPSVCTSNISCPQHGTQIFPPIGGNNSFALIITGRDETDAEIQQTFFKDCHEMELAIAHPHIMAVPWKNIYRISPFENPNDVDIIRVLHTIVKQKPDFFLLYYSGHVTEEGETPRLDVSDAQGHTLNIERLQRSLLPLRKTCSRMLILPDCCYAASLGSLVQPEQFTDDSHIIFHTTWSSCGRSELSNMQPYEANSLFTKCLLDGLRGGRKCPNDIQSCPHCEHFRKEVEATHWVSKKILEQFVNMHMRCTFQENREDVQGPIVIESRRESDPVIAYFRNEALYRFHYESPKGQSVVNKVCKLDSLEYDVDEVLVCLWNQLKDKIFKPSVLDHRTLQILCRKSDGSVEELTEVSGIIKAVFEDADSLVVSIRTDGKKLDKQKWVVCYCDVSQTKDTAKSLLSLERNQCRTEEHGVKKLSVREVNTTWRAADNNAFDETLQKCWNSFLSLKQQDEDSFLQIEIREKLSMLSITTQQSS